MILALLAPVLLAWVAGGVVLASVCDWRNLRRSERAVVSLVVGLGCVSLCMTLLCMAGIRPAAWNAVPALAVFAGAFAGWRVYRRRGVPPSAEPADPERAAGHRFRIKAIGRLYFASPGDTLTNLLALLIAFLALGVVGWVFWYARWLTYKSDEYIVWIWLAKRVFYGEGIVAHHIKTIAYPLHIPMAAAWCTLFSGGWDEFSVKLLSPLHAALTFGIGYIVLRRFAFNRAFCALIGLFLITRTTYTYWIPTLYGDIPVGYHVLLGVGYAALWLRTGRRTDATIAAIGIALALWTKREGTVLLLALMLLLGLRCLRQAWERRADGRQALLSGMRGWVSVVGLALFVAVAWFVFVRLKHGGVLGNQHGTRVMWEHLPLIVQAYWRDIWSLVPEYHKGLGRCANWRPTLALLLAGVVLARGRFWRDPYALLWQAWLLFFVLEALNGLFVPQRELLEHHLIHSGVRFALHHLPLATVWAAICIGESAREAAQALALAWPGSAVWRACRQGGACAAGAAFALAVAVFSAGPVLAVRWYSGGSTLRLVERVPARATEVSVPVGPHRLVGYEVRTPRVLTYPVEKNEVRRGEYAEIHLYWSFSDDRTPVQSQFNFMLSPDQAAFGVHATEREGPTHPGLFEERLIVLVPWFQPAGDCFLHVMLMRQRGEGRDYGWSSSLFGRAHIGDRWGATRQQMKPTLPSPAACAPLRENPYKTIWLVGAAFSRQGAQASVRTQILTLAPLDEALWVQTRVVRPDTGELLAISTHVPELGWAPTTAWQPGELVFHDTPLRLPPNVPPPYRVVFQLVTAEPNPVPLGNPVTLEEALP